MSAPGRLSPDEWRKVNDLFHRAIDLTADGRASLLAEACPRDPHVKVEVEALLAAHARTTAILDRPAAAWVDPAELDPLVGREVGHYRVTGRLGSGGMGVVYRADDTRLGRPVALKAIAPDFTTDPARRERLRREARAAAGLTHPGIATIYALEEVDGQMYIASELVEGETLRDALARGPLAPTRVVDIGIGLARAVAAAHASGVVHRDLKPENVIGRPDGSIKILDFGLARFRDTTGEATLTGDRGMLGTPAYMSPEQIRGEAVDERSDVFSLGVVLYELATGRSPFAAADSAATLARVLEFDPPSLSDPDVPGAVASIGHGLAALIQQCLRKAPDDRPPSAQAVARALEAVRAGDPPVDAGAHAGRAAGADARWWWRFHQMAMVAAYLVLLPPLWIASGWVDGRAGTAVFALGAAAGSAAAVLRLHLLFAASTLPRELAVQRDRVRPWLRLADGAFVSALALVGAMTLGEHPVGGTTLVAAAVVLLVVSTLVEPATTRAALDDPNRT